MEGRCAARQFVPDELEVRQRELRGRGGERAGGCSKFQRGGGGSVEGVAGRSGGQTKGGYSGRSEEGKSGQAKRREARRRQVQDPWPSTLGAPEEAEAEAAGSDRQRQKPREALARTRAAEGGGAAARAGQAENVASRPLRLAPERGGELAAALRPERKEVSGTALALAIGRQRHRGRGGRNAAVAALPRQCLGRGRR